jgi:hypothetical protein
MKGELMKRIFIILLLFLPIVCYADIKTIRKSIHGMAMNKKVVDSPEIIPVSPPGIISGEERARVVKFLNYIFEKVTDNDLQLDETVCYSGRTYRGFFIKANLLKNSPPVELFLYYKQGGCHVCQQSGIAIVNKDDTINDFVNFYASWTFSDVSIIKYDDEGTCIIIGQNASKEGGNSGPYSECEIYRLNPRKKFEKIYSKLLMEDSIFGNDVDIGVTFTAYDKSGYRDIVINEYLKPHPVSTVLNNMTGVLSMGSPASIDQTITISMKIYEYKDKLNSIKWFFENLYRKKKQ